MDDLKMKVEIEIDRVYANKDKKERQHVVFNRQKPQASSNMQLDTLRGLPSDRTLNNDLGDLLVETLEPPD